MKVLKMFDERFYQLPDMFRRYELQFTPQVISIKDQLMEAVNLWITEAETLQYRHLKATLSMCIAHKRMQRYHIPMLADTEGVKEEWHCNGKA